MKHVCHAVGCNIEVPARLLMCKNHWYCVPIALRNRVYETYRPGQEITKDPSPAYLAAHHAAVAAVAERDGKTKEAAEHQRMSESYARETSP